MAVILAEGSPQHRHTPSYELVMRAMREFDDMPTLRITLEQAMRLFSFDRATCLSVLGALEDACIIQRDRSGRYHRVSID